MKFIFFILKLKTFLATFIDHWNNFYIFSTFRGQNFQPSPRLRHWMRMNVCDDMRRILPFMSYIIMDVDRKNRKIKMRKHACNEWRHWIFLNTECYNNILFPTVSDLEQSKLKNKRYTYSLSVFGSVSVWIWNQNSCFDNHHLISVVVNREH